MDLTSDVDNGYLLSHCHIYNYINYRLESVVPLTSLFTNLTNYDLSVLLLVVFFSCHIS